MTSKKDAVSTSLHYLQAARIPLIQRLNQQFEIESSFESYANDIQSLGNKNRALLDSIDDQQSRLQAMRSMLHQVDDNQESAPNRCCENASPESIPIQGDSVSIGKSKAKVTNSQNDEQHSSNDITIHRREKRNESIETPAFPKKKIPQPVASNDESDYRRSQFLYRIASIEQSIGELEKKNDNIPAQQAFLARKMQRLQQRILSLVSEIERVSHLEENAFVTSDLLHACRQTFTKKQLLRSLQLEVTSCRSDIATCREEMIGLKKHSDSIAADIVGKREQLGDRKAALLQYDKKCSVISKMRIVVSKEPGQLKKYYFSSWKEEVAEHKRVRKILESISALIRRRLCATAWKHWTRLGSSSNQSSDISKGKNSGGGICTDDLLVQEARLKDNIDESYAILKKILKTDEPDEQDSTTANLGEEDEAILLKGEFLFNAQHYEASLKCYERIETVLGSQCLQGTTAIGLCATVASKIGRIHLAMQHVDLAIVYFGRSLSLSHEEHGFEMHRVSALIGLSECYMQKHDFNYACYFLQQALPLLSSRCDTERENIVYSLLQQCYEHLNKSEEVAFYSSKIHGLRDTRKERVEAAFDMIGSMRQRLIDVSARNSRVVKVRASSTKHVTLTKLMKAKENELADTNKALMDSREFSSQLEDFEKEVTSELDTARNTKKNRIISLRVHDSSQEIIKKELLFRLDEKLEMTRAKQQECLREIASLERKVMNLKDDMCDLTEEMEVEQRPLVERVLDLRIYRCIEMNASNTALGNVIGSGGNEYVALTYGKDCYVHNMDSGELETVFMGDVEGMHIGELLGHTATITALFFHGTRIYTGSVDASIICWDIDSTAKLFESKGHEGAVTCIFSDGTKILSGAADKSIIIWSCDGLLLHRILGHAGGIHQIRCDLSWFASSSYDTIFVWEMINHHDTGQIVQIKCRQRLCCSSSPRCNVTALHFSESELVTGDSLGYVKLWNIQSAEVISSVKAHEGSLTCLQVDTTKAVSCGLDMLVQVTDIIQGVVIQTLRGHTAPPLCVAFDQKQIVSVSSDGEIRMWSWRR